MVSRRAETTSRRAETTSLLEQPLRKLNVRKREMADKEE